MQKIFTIEELKLLNEMAYLERNQGRNKKAFIFSTIGFILIATVASLAAKSISVVTIMSVPFYVAIIFYIVYPDKKKLQLYSIIKQLTAKSAKKHKK